MVEFSFFDKTFELVGSLEKGEYENCTFINCDFSGIDLSYFRFIDCVFKGSNMSMVKINGTMLQRVHFVECKMLGLQFCDCNEFGLSFWFEGCNISHATFYKTKIKKLSFINCQLQECDFTECDLTGVLFDNCDLTGAIFDKTKLEKADLRSSYHYSIDPEINYIKYAKFSILGVKGLLNKYEIDIQ